MVLAEALACGIPAVAFSISSGVGDILRDGQDGLLTPMGDIPAFANALASLMADQSRRQAMSQCASSVLSRYGVDLVMDRWDALVHDLVLNR